MNPCRFPILRRCSILPSPSPSLRRRRRRRPHLPIEIIAAILSILPVDSVVRFRYVSKLWHELISDPAFIRSHLGRAPLQIILRKSGDGSGDGGLSSLSTTHYDLITHDDDDETTRETLAITYHRGSQPAIGSMFTSCDGLIYSHPPVCLTHTDSPAPGIPPAHNPKPNIIITPNPAAGGSLCNPLLGELIFLPDSHKQSMGSVCGFFFHASSNQYRLLRVSPWPPYVDPPPPCFEYEILALGPEEESSFAWRSIPSSTSQSPNDRPPAILENKLHWVSDSENPAIIVFNTDTEDFRSIQMPQGTLPEFSKLIEVDQCLCLFQISSDSSHTEMWILKDYAKEVWQKKYDIPTEKIGVYWPGPICSRPICVFHGEIVFYWFTCGLLYYNPKLNSFRTVSLCKSSSISVYRKSLVSLLALNKNSRNHFITSTVSSYGISS